MRADSRFREEGGGGVRDDRVFRAVEPRISKTKKKEKSGFDGLHVDF